MNIDMYIQLLKNHHNESLDAEECEVIAKWLEELKHYREVGNQLNELINANSLLKEILGCLQLRSRTTNNVEELTENTQKSRWGNDEIVLDIKDILQKMEGRKMKDFRPNGCKMYVAIKDMDFQPFDLGDDVLHILKGDVWMLKQITISGKIWLNKQCDGAVLQISEELLKSDFVEVNLNEVNMNTVYKFKEDECTRTVILNGYEVESETYSWSFYDFCEYMGYPL